jgi:polysaccharide export outer membrane protein
MFKTPHDYEFDTPDEVTDENYKIAPGDIIQFTLYANNGFMIIDLSSLGAGGSSNDTRVNNRTIDIQYFIEDDGYVKIPSLLRVKMAGFTVFEAETFLEKEYSKYYVEPFVILRVTNRRVIVSTGDGGTSKVVTLKNTNTRLIEALAEAGGIVDRGRAKKVKVIRQIDGEHEVYLFDLSKIEGVEAADMIVQANDIIYVTPSPQIATELLKTITPVLALFTGLVAAYALILAAPN